MKSQMLLVAVVALASLASAVQIQPDTTTVVTDATIGDYAGGIEFVPATDEQTPGVVEFDTTSVPTMAITGKGVVKKTSAGNWTLTAEQKGFTGDFIVEKGVVTCTKAVQCGSIAADTGAVYVRSGAALNLNITTGTADDKFTARAIHIAGTGCGDCRALHVTKAPSGAINLLYLDDNAAIYVRDNSNHYWLSSEGSPKFGDSRGHLYTGGHVISKYGAMIWPFLGVDVHGGGRIVVCEGQSEIRDAKWPLEEGEEHQPFELTAGRNFMFWNRPQPVPRPLLIDGSSKIYYTQNSTSSMTLLTTNYSNWAGPVDLHNAASVLTLSPDCSDWRHQVTISGPISGPGKLVVGVSGSGRGRVALAGENTYTGGTTVHGGADNILELYRPESIPLTSPVTINGGHIAAMAESEDATEGWTKESIWNYLNTIDFGQVGGFHINASDCTDKAYTLSVDEFNENVTRPMAPIGSEGGTLTLTAEEGAETTLPRLNAIYGTTVIDGAAKLTLAGTNAVGGACASWDDAPELRIQGGAELLQGDDPFFAGNMQLADSRHRAKIVLSNATWRTLGLKTPSGNLAGQFLNTVLLGSGYGDAILDLQDGAVFSNKVITGLRGFPNSGSGSGAIYVGAGAKFAAPSLGAIHLTSALGMAGFGYLQFMPGSELIGKMPTVGGYGKGVCHLYGGDFTLDSGWEFDGCNQGCGYVYLTNAVIRTSGILRASNGQSGDCQFVVDGPEAAVYSSSSFYAMQSPEAKRAIVSVCNGGIFSIYQFVNYKKDAECTYRNPFVVNFDGGTIRMYYTAALFGSEEAKVPVVVVGAKGGTLDTNGQTYSQHANVPLSSRKENGIRSVAWTDGEVSGLVGAPIVRVTSSAGYGAALVADWDPERRVLKGVKVCSSGWGYDPENIKVELSCGHWSKTLTKDSVTVGETETGGMTFKGTGSVVLNATNEWEKWTGLEGGVKVKVVHQESMKSGTELRLNGGTLNLNDLGDDAPTFCSLSGTGGTVQNGAVKLVGTNGTVDLSAKQYLSGATCALSGTLDLSDVTAIRITDTDLLPEETKDLHSKNLFSATEIVNWENVEITGVPDGWRAVKTANALRFCPPRGIVLLVR